MAIFLMFLSGIISILEITSPIAIDVFSSSSKLISLPKSIPDCLEWIGMIPPLAIIFKRAGEPPSEREGYRAKAQLFTRLLNSIEPIFKKPHR